MQPKKNFFRNLKKNFIQFMITNSGNFKTFCLVLLHFSSLCIQKIKKFFIYFDFYFKSYSFFFFNRFTTMLKYTVLYILYKFYILVSCKYVILDVLYLYKYKSIKSLYLITSFFFALKNNLYVLYTLEYDIKCRYIYYVTYMYIKC